MEEQIIDSEKSYSGKFPTFLLVLLILTSINVFYQIYSASTAMIYSEERLEDASEEIMEAFDMSGMDMSELPAWAMDGMQDFFSHFIDNLYSYELYSLIFHLIVGAAIILMFKLKMAGLQLYIVMQIIGVIDYFFFFGINFISIAMAIGTGILALIFILLYWANRQHLH